MREALLEVHVDVDDRLCKAGVEGSSPFVSTTLSRHYVPDGDLRVDQWLRVSRVAEANFAGRGISRGLSEDGRERALKLADGLGVLPHCFGVTPGDVAVWPNEEGPGFVDFADLRPGTVRVRGARRADDDGAQERQVELLGGVCPCLASQAGDE